MKHKKEYQLAIVPGSFDPMTIGHLEIVKMALEQSEKVVVAVMNNREKEYLFDMSERVKIAEATVADIPHVEVVGDSGMLVDLYQKLGANAVIKGYRNGKDSAYEQEMADWNKAHLPAFNTVLIPCKKEMENISSTAVREALKEGKMPTDMMTESALALALSILNKKK